MVEEGPVGVQGTRFGLSEVDASEYLLICVAYRYDDDVVFGRKKGGGG